MSKLIEFDNEARKKLLEGASKLSKAVVSTLGPFGRNVLFTENGELRSTKDGVTVAKQIALEDPIENMGAEAVKQASINSARQAGDGTTTTTLLAYEIIKEGLGKVDRGANATQIKKEIDSAVKEVVAELRSMSVSVSENSQLEQIATISANNDVETGKLIAQALDKVGVEGVVSIEESKTGETYLEIVEGMQFDRGYKSPFFVTNNNTMQAVLEEPSIFIFDGKITQAKELLPLLEAVSAKNDSLLIIAEDIDGEALATLIVNKMRGILKICAVKAPDFGERRTLILEDMAVLTGATVISKDKGNKLDKMNADAFLKALGKTNRVTVTKDKTTLIDGKGDVDKILARAEELKEQLDKALGFEREKLQDRLAKLTSGVAVVYVGGANDVEMKEYKDRVEDALFATKAAIEEGILPGGGVALFNARNVLKTKYDVGSQIVFKSLSKPLEQILSNAGIDDVHVYTYKISESGEPWKGYNLKTESFENMREVGILDPTKVVRLALENAAAVAGTILITACTIYEKPDATGKAAANNLPPEMNF